LNLNPWKVATIGLAAIVLGGGCAVAGTQLGSGSPSRPPAVASTPPAGSPASSPAPHPPSSAAPLFVTPAWSGIKPASIVLSADGGNIPYDLTWSQWNDHGAVGQGLVGIQSCNPNCAQGTTTARPVRITLSRVQDGHYTYITESITGRANPTKGSGPITSGWPFGASSKRGPDNESPSGTPITQHLTSKTSD
jgi:hypothetical protein